MIGSDPENAGLPLDAATDLAEGAVFTTPPRSAEELLHELQVHQIELEVQNEALREAQYALEKSQEQFVEFYEFSPVGYLTLTEEGLIVDINLRGAELIGIERGKLKRQPFAGVIAPGSADLWHSHFFSVLQRDERQDCELTLRADERSPVHVRLDSLRLEKGGRSPVVRVVMTDITARRQAEEALQASEMRFRKLLESIPVAVQGYGEDGITHYWNRASEQLYGYSAAEVIGRCLLDLIVPAHLRQGFRESMRQMFNSGQPLPTVELSLMRKDGSRVEVLSSHAYVEVSGQAPELFCLHFDLTERKRAQQDLAESEQRFSLFMDTLPAAVFIKDASGSTLYANRYLTNIMGSRDWLGKSTRELFPPDVAERMIADDRRSIEAGYVLAEEHIAGVDGQARLYQTHKFRISRQGQPPLLGGIALDVTEREDAAAELVRAKAEAEKANRAKSRFLAAASHDLRQPLSALSLYIGALSLNLKRKGAADQPELFSNIESCVNSLSALLTDILDVSKLDAGVVKPTISRFSMDELLAEIVSVQAVEAELKGLRLRRRPSGAIALSDRVLISRILGNLIANAVRYTDQGSVLVACRCHRGKHWVEVWDTGRGIPADKTQIIFDEFTQLGDEARNRGSGLGLSIAAKTAAVLGLEIRLCSRPGKGSLFAVEIPLTRSRLADTPGAAALAKQRPVRVALVDDNLHVRLALGMLLERNGHEVLAAASGSLLVQALAGMAPDIVIADYRLADGETGFDVIAELRRLYGDGLPAIVITGDTDPALVRSMSDRGIAVHYKPLNADALLAVISQATERRRVGRLQ